MLYISCTISKSVVFLEHETSLQLAVQIVFRVNVFRLLEVWFGNFQISANFMRKTIFIFKKNAYNL